MVEGLQALGDKRTPKQTTFLEWMNKGMFGTWFILPSAHDIKHLS